MAYATYAGLKPYAFTITVVYCNIWKKNSKLQADVLARFIYSPYSTCHSSCHRSIYCPYHLKCVKIDSSFLAKRKHQLTNILLFCIQMLLKSFSRETFILFSCNYNVRVNLINIRQIDLLRLKWSRVHFGHLCKETSSTATKTAMLFYQCFCLSL